MGLGDIFRRNKRNYAQEFKEIYETTPISMDGLARLMKEWDDDSSSGSSSDANFFLAMALNSYITGTFLEQRGEADSRFKQASVAAIERSKGLKPKDASLHDWFSRTADEMINSETIVVMNV